MVKITSRNSRHGFTFLEIILVVAIIGVLAAMVGPRLVGKSRQAKISAAATQLNNYATSLQTFEISAGRFPSTSEGLEAMVRKPSGIDERDWTQALNRLAKDPWGEDYIYSHPSDHEMDFDISSKGPDRVEGTEDDITSWDDGEDGNL